MWPAKQLDIGWSDLAAVAGAGLTRFRPAEGAAALARSWGHGSGIACLSVRTGFDLLLSALELPPGSEILMSAVTIPDMVRIVAHHGLVAVPVDLDLKTLAPRRDAIAAAITPRTRAIVVAHLFGARAPQASILEIARRQGLLVIEDLAQGFAGPQDAGDPDSDAAMFSFGTIKTATALGGALLRIRDSALLRKMQKIAGEYPVQSRTAYLSRLLKYGLLKGATTWAGYTALVALLRAAGYDHDRLAAKLVRGFPAERLIEQLRQQPSAPLVALLARRLKRFDAERLRRRSERGRELAARLELHYTVPGCAAATHSHWIFPVLTSGPQRLIEQLARAGFHATQGRSMCAVAAPVGRPELAPINAQRLLREGVFLPVYPELPEAEFQRLTRLLLEFAEDAQHESATRAVRRPAYCTTPFVTARNTSSSD
jgi:dTDP-4-amino-4,6-dideoxygalactose transaminase